MKPTEDLARQLQKCTGYMLPYFVYPAISCTKLAAFVVRRGAGRKRAGYAINQWDMRSRFLSVTRATRNCSEPKKFYGLQHIIMVQCSDGMFSQILEISIIFSRIWLNMPYYVMQAIKFIRL